MDGVLVPRQTLDALRRALESLNTVIGVRPHGGSVSTPSHAPPGLRAALQIQVWEGDPSLHAVAGQDPAPAQLVDEEVPKNDHELLQTHIKEDEPAPGIYEPTTPEFRYWNMESALARGTSWSGRGASLCRASLGWGGRARFFRDSGARLICGDQV